MTYFTRSVQRRLQQAFTDNNMVLSVKSDHMIAEDSHAYSKEKIQKIIESAKFCPLISQNKINRNFVFTVSPYKIPDVFNQKDPLKNESRWQWLKIVGVSTLAAVIYGISNDLLQKDNCPEYWSFGHIYGNWNFVSARQQPIANAVIWGTLASWWAGASAGIILGVASRFPLPYAKKKINIDQFYKPLLMIGGVGLYLGHLVSIATKNIVATSIKMGANFAPMIPKIHEFYDDLPIERQPDWFSCAFRNNTGYLTALIGTVGLTIGALYSRYQQERF